MLSVVVDNDFEEFMLSRINHYFSLVVDTTSIDEDRNKHVSTYNELCRVLHTYQGFISHGENRHPISIKNLRALPYFKYLETPHWQQTRNRALRRAEFKCELCNDNGQLHVHHKTYENRGQERNADLIVLCSDCHSKFHDKVEK